MILGGQFSPIHVCLSNSQPHTSLEAQPFSLAGVPAISSFLSFFFLRESPPHINFNCNCGSPRHISILRESPPILGLHSFQFHQLPPNLISKDEENNWSSTVIHNFTFHHRFTQSSSQFNLITIIVHNLCSIHMARILINKNTKSIAHFNNMYAYIHSIPQFTILST